MHDPDTVAFEVKYPWYARKHWPHRRWVPASWRSPHWKDGYRETFLTIWHHDPSNHDNDVCGWHYQPLTAREKAFAKELADWEEKHPYYFAQPIIAQRKSYADDDGRTTTYNAYRISAGDCVALVSEFFRQLRWRLDPGRRRAGLTPKLIEEVFSLGSTDGNNFQSAFAFWDDEGTSDRHRREKIERTFMLLIRSYRTATRPWWRHPKWHVHHWRVQVHPMQTFKRWAFTRCKECGARFAWGETGIGTWHGHGPRWFKSETLTHMRCDRSKVQRAA